MHILCRYRCFCQKNSKTFSDMNNM